MFDSVCGEGGYLCWSHRLLAAWRRYSKCENCGKSKLGGAEHYQAYDIKGGKWKPVEGVCYISLVPGAAERSDR